VWGDGVGAMTRKRRIAVGHGSGFGCRSRRGYFDGSWKMRHEVFRDLGRKGQSETHRLDARRDPCFLHAGRLQGDPGEVHGRELSGHRRGALARMVVYGV
jgi:hypothetical protein